MTRGIVGGWQMAFAKSIAVARISHVIGSIGVIPIVSVVPPEQNVGVPLLLVFGTWLADTKPALSPVRAGGSVQPSFGCSRLNAAASESADIGARMMANSFSMIRIPPRIVDPGGSHR